MNLARGKVKRNMCHDYNEYSFLVCNSYLVPLSDKDWLTFALLFDCYNACVFAITNFRLLNSYSTVPLLAEVVEKCCHSRLSPFKKSSVPQWNFAYSFWKVSIMFKRSWIQPNLPSSNYSQILLFACIYEGTLWYPHRIGLIQHNISKKFELPKMEAIKSVSFC